MQKQSWKARKWLKLAAGLMCLAFFAMLWFSDAADYLRDPELLAATVAHGGWFSVFVFGGAFVAVGSLAIPPAVFVIAAGLLWPFPIALVLSLVAGCASASLGFLGSRYIARDACAAHIPAKLRKFSEHLRSRGFRAVVVLRLVFYLFPPVNWMLGLSHIRFRDFLAGSLLGMLPGTLLYLLLGKEVVPWLLSLPPTTLAWVIGIAALLVLAWHGGRTMFGSESTAKPGMTGAGKGAPSTSPDASAFLEDAQQPVSFSLLWTSIKTFVRLSGRTFLPPKPYPRPPSLKRCGIMLLFLPLFAAVQGVHWIALLLDDVLFPEYRQCHPHSALFVVGVPRSGTTFLHRVLAQDTDRFTTFSLWELIFAPAICERRLILGLGRFDRLFGAPFKRFISWVTARATGGMDAVHRLSLQAAEEDFLLLMPILSCFILIVAFPFATEIQDLSQFDDAVPEARRKRVLAFYYALVQRHLYVHGEGRVFLSKNVSFTPMLRSLLSAFPDARIVACTRPPQEAVPSQISSMEKSWHLFGNTDTPELFEARWLELMAYSYCHLAEVLPQIPAQQRVCFEMQDLRTRVRHCVETLYRRFGFELGARFEASLDRETEASQAYRSGHKYALDDYGLDETTISRRYGQAYAELKTMCKVEDEDEGRT